MNGIIDQAYCSIVGKALPMRIRILLRLINGVVIVLIYRYANMDYVLIYGLIVVIADIDAIAEYLEKRKKDKC